MNDRQDIDLLFPPIGDKIGLCVSIRLSPAQAESIRQAASAAGLHPGAWAQRHMLAAAGCLPFNSPDDAPILRQIHEAGVYLDSLLVTKQ